MISEQERRKEEELSTVRILEHGIKQPAISQFLKHGTGLSMDNIELICNYLGIKSIEIPKIKPTRLSLVKTEIKSMTEVLYLHLTKCLTENDWNISETAKSLGVSRWKLYKEIKSLNIVKPQKAKSRKKRHA